MPRPGEPDYYRSRARAEGYVARAVYKLKEVDDKYHLIKPGHRVWTWGAARVPGCNTSPPGWVPGVLVVGVDLNPPAIPLAPPFYSSSPERWAAWTFRA